MGELRRHKFCVKVAWPNLFVTKMKDFFFDVWNNLNLPFQSRVAQWKSRSEMDKNTGSRECVGGGGHSRFVCFSAFSLSLYLLLGHALARAACIFKYCFFLVSSQLWSGFAFHGFFRDKTGVLEFCTHTQKKENRFSPPELCARCDGRRDYPSGRFHTAEQRT